MPEKYEIFLDKNKKVKLAANDQGDFFAEANGNRIKLGEQGLQTINKTTGAPESVGGTDPDPTLSTIQGNVTNGFGEDSGRTTFTHTSLPGETLIGWYANQQGTSYRPRLFLQVNPAYLVNNALLAPDGSTIYEGNNGPFEISLKINGNVYGPMTMNLNNASWYLASQINWSGATHNQIVIQNAWQQVTNFAAMEADILAVANSTELAGAGPFDAFSNGFSGRNGGIYGIPLSADIELYIVQDINVTTPIKFSSATTFDKVANGLYVDNDVVPLFTNSSEFDNKSAYSTTDLRFNYSGGSLQTANFITTGTINEGGCYALRINDGNDITSEVGFGNNDTEEFFGIELDLHRSTDNRAKGLSYIDILLGYEGYINSTATGHKHLLFFFKKGQDATNAAPGEYYLYTLNSVSDGPWINNSAMNSLTTGMPRNNLSTNNTADIGTFDTAQFWSAGKGNILRIYHSDTGTVSGKLLMDGADGVMQNINPGVGGFGTASQPGNVLTIDLNYMAGALGYTGVSDNGNPYGHSDYTDSTKHIKIPVVPNQNIFVTDTAAPNSQAISNGNVIGLILDCSYLRNGDFFGFTLDAIQQAANGSNFSGVQYNVNVVIKYGSRGYVFWAGGQLKFGTTVMIKFIGSSTTGEFLLCQPSGSMYNTSSMSAQTALTF